MTTLINVFGCGSSQIKVMKDGTLRFCYEVPQGTAEFSLYSEVGEPHKAKFERIFKELNLKLGEKRELTAYPWYADTLKRNAQ